MKKITIKLSDEDYERLMSLCYAHAVTPEKYLNHFTKLDEKELREKGYSHKF
jgi:hypothetical protein